jgi:lipoprotein-releasing system permease protein
MVKDEALMDSILAIGPIQYVRPTRIGEEENKKIEKTKSGVSEVHPFIVVPGIVSSRQNYEGLLLKGFDHTSGLDHVSPFIQQGEMIQFSDSTASRDILLSEQTASRMNFGVGDRLVVHFILDEEQVKRAFTVSGIYRTGLEEYDRRFALVDMRILQQVLEWDSNMVSGLEIFIDHLPDLSLLNEYIYFEKLPGNLYSESIETKFYQIFEWLELQDINEQVIIALMIIVAIINMATALLIFVLERTRMIGILKALGASNWSIRRIFLYNAGEIVIKGLIAGNLLALTLCFLQMKTGILKLREQDYYLSEVPIEFNIPAILYINMGTIAITLLFLVLPSALVSKIEPVKAIQFS